MKSLLSMVFEAGIPSKITKKKTNIIKKTNRYKFGDVNDTVSGTYNQEDEYFKNNSQGYIIDRKTGTKHDVVDASYNSDSGAIAGVQYSRYDGFNDKFKKFLKSIKVTKDNFYTIMPIQNMKTRPNAVYNFN